MGGVGRPAVACRAPPAGGAHPWPGSGARLVSGGELRLGLAGCGRLAEAGYVPALARVPELSLAAVADPDADRRKRLVAAGAISSVAPAGAAAPVAYESVEAMLAAGPLDLVVIATPAAEHVHHAELAARAGMHSLVEKPPTPDAMQATRLAALEPAPWIGFNRRFLQGIELEDSVPATGSLELELKLCYRRASWSSVAVDDDALLDLGPLLIDLALELVGEPPLAVRAAELAWETAVLELTTARSSSRIMVATNRAHRELVEVRDEGGTLLGRSRIGGRAGALAARIARRDHPLVPPITRQLEAVVRAMREGGRVSWPPRSTG